MTTIRAALTWKLLLAFVVPLAAAGVATHLLIRDELVEQFDDTLVARATAVAAVTRQTGETVVVDLPPRLVEEFEAPASRQRVGDTEGDEEREDRDEGYFEIRGRDGTLVARSASLGQADLPNPSRTGEEGAAIGDIRLPNGASGRAVALRVTPRLDTNAPESGSESLILVLAAARTDLDRTLAFISLLLTGAGVLLLGTVVVLVPHLIRQAFIPLDRLGEQAAGIDATTLGTRFPTVNLPGELDAIAGRLNDLLSRLETSFERERRFSDALAHELRTPVAELRSLAEVAIKWPDARTADTDRDVLAVATHMEGIVSRLLVLLRSEDGRLATVREPVDLAALARAAWQEVAGDAAHRGVSVEWEMRTPAHVQSDHVLVRAILSNLIGNAVAYSPAGSSIRIGGGERSLTISNNITGVTPTQLDQMFERFWRLDPSRTGSEHAGLGLPLARTFARALGGDLTAVLEGARITFIWTFQTSASQTATSAVLQNHPAH